MHPAIVHVGLWLGFIVPVVLRARQRVGERRRHVNEDTVVLRSGFKHEDADAFILGETVREHAAGRSCADDDVVVVARQHARPYSAAFCSAF